MNKIRVKFGKKIRKIRETQGLSQEELAYKAGLHRTYIGSIERGERNPCLDNIAKIAKALGVSLNNLFQDL